MNNLRYLKEEDYGKLLEDVIDRLSLTSRGEYELNTYSWQQTWSDSCCGFPGAGGQTITNATTVIFELLPEDPNDFRIFYVYHAGRFAYELIDDAFCEIDDFMDDMMDHSVLGQVDYKLRYQTTPPNMCTCLDCQCAENSTIAEKAEQVFRHEFRDEVIQLVKNHMKTLSFDEALTKALEDIHERMD